MCKYCGKQFDGGTKLRAHVNVHEGEYKCRGYAAMVGVHLHDPSPSVPDPFCL